MVVLERLEQEHREVLEKFGLLTVTLQDIETRGVELLKDQGSLKAISDLLEHAIPDHFEKEEKVLFPFLEKVIPSERRFVAELLGEHERIMKAIAAFLKDVRSPAVSLDELRNRLRTLTEDISAHAKKENEELLPLARRFLSEAQLKELDRLASQIVRT